MEENKLNSANLEPMGFGLFNHSLECWLCNKNPAVYSANPDWCFYPCWECQSRVKGRWTKRTFLQRLSNN